MKERVLINLFFIFLGNAIVTLNVDAGAILHGARTQPKVALTFDACSSIHQSEMDDEVIQILVDTQTPATLFLGGKWIRDLPEKAKYLAQFPFFELGSHSFYHPHLPQKDEKRIRWELKQTQKQLKKLNPQLSMLFRAPYGELDERVVQIAESMGLKVIQYDLPSGDPDPHLSEARLQKRVLAGVKNGSIVVFHMNRKGWKTSKILKPIIEGLKAKGFELVKVSDLL